MEQGTDTVVTSGDRLTALVDSSLGLVFVGLAAWFLVASPPASIPLSPASTVSIAQIEPGPRRIAIGDPPSTVIGGFSHTCNDCHRLFSSLPRTDQQPSFQHKAVVLRHGMNNRCFNCHDVKDRERLTLRDGTTVSYAQTPQLCAQCHGTVFRDWEHGMHGKTLGSWLAASGKQRRLNCNECHDPHAPAYDPIQPLPGPNTLRMGEQGETQEHSDRHMPLRRWSNSPGADSHPSGTPARPEEGPP